MSYKEKRNLFIFGFCIGVLIFLTIIKLGYAKVDKITWCHTEPNGNSQTLELPLAALQNAGHVDAQGNPLHAGDHAGECVEPTTVPSPTPCIRISPTSIPEVTTTVTVAPTVEPTRIPTVTVEPTETPKAGGWSPQPENPNDGRSDGGRSSDFEAKEHPVTIPSCKVAGNCINK